MATVEHYRGAFQNDMICLCCGVADSAVNPGRASSSIAVDTPYGRPRIRSSRGCWPSSNDRLQGGPRWIWSYHNYGDQERSTDRVQYLRRASTHGGWRGLHRDGGPALAATEGGVRLATMRSIYRPLSAAS